MAKRSKRNQVDLISETQSNAKWFFGRRSRVSWMDMTESEWSQHWRSMRSQQRSGLIFMMISSIVIGVLLSIGSISAVRNSGLSYASILFGLLSILFWAWLILYLRWLFRKE